MFRPSNQMSPAVIGIVRSTQRPIVVFPEPLSPTKARVSPGHRAKVTSLTAVSTFFPRRKA